MNATLAALADLPRPARPVTLPGGAAVHVRDVSLRELRQIDERAEDLPEGPERNVRWSLLLCGYALCDADGFPVCPTGPTGNDLAGLEALTLPQVEAIARAVVPSKDEAKN